MLLTKDEVRTFDELTTQLIVFERNIKKPSKSDNEEQEALLIKFDQKKSSTGNFPSFRSKKNDLCNYCYKKGCWVRNCKKWITDGRPSCNSATYSANSIEAQIALVLIHSEVLVVEPNTEDWFVDNGATKHITSHSDLFRSFNKFVDICLIKAVGD